MPVIEAEKVEFKEPAEGEDYIVVEAVLETAKTQDSDKTPVIKVALEPIKRKKDDRNIYNEGLWVTQNYTPTSKLGSFLTAFESYFKDNNMDKEKNYKDTDSWVGAIIRVLSWGDKNRKISVREYVDVSVLKKLQKELADRRKKTKQE